MWIKKVLSWFGSNALPVETKVEMTNLSDRVTAVATLNTLFPEQFAQYKARVGEAVLMHSVYPNIEVYTEKLREATIALKYDRAIKPHWLPGPSKEMDVDSFLVSKDEHYLNNEQAVAKFKSVALEFCDYFQKTENQIFGVQENNSRMLAKLLANLCVVTDALVEVSLMN